MLGAEGSLHMLAGGLRVKARVQHPEVTQRKDRQSRPWIYRYRDDEIQPEELKRLKDAIADLPDEITEELQ